MKNKITCIFMLMLLLFISTSCDNQKYDNNVSVILPSGTPAIAMGGLMDKYSNIETVTNTDLLKTAFLTGTNDIIIAPVTMGASLYLANKSSYLLEAVITINNTYVIANDSSKLDDINDLKNKEIIAYQENNTPGILLKLATVNLDVNIQFEKTINDAVPGFSQGKFEYCLMAEPQITKLRISTNKQFNIIDLSQCVKEKITFMPQAAVFVKKDKVNDREIINFLESLKRNIRDMNQNPEEYAKKLVKLDNTFFDSLGERVIKESIPNSNIDYIKAKENRDTLNKYYEIMDEYSNNIFGGKIPSEEFYRS